MSFGAMLPSVLDGFLMVSVYLLGITGLTVGKVDTELSFEVVVLDGIASRIMRLAVQGAGVGVTLDRHQRRSALPQVLGRDLLGVGHAVHLAQDRGIAGGQRLGVHMVEAGKDEESGKVCEVLQKGYRLADKIIRHAMVKVTM